MVGGNQLKDRRNKLRVMLDNQILLSVKDDSWKMTYAVNGILEFRKPDKGYFLKDTNAKIILPYIKSIDLELKAVSMDLSNSLIKTSRNYLEAQEKWQH
jgi:hypothetical protein